jgi:hypothetical protein
VLNRNRGKIHLFGGRLAQGSHLVNKIVRQIICLRFGIRFLILLLISFIGTAFSPLELTP